MAESILILTSFSDYSLAILNAMLTMILYQHNETIISLFRSIVAAAKKSVASLIILPL